MDNADVALIVSIVSAASTAAALVWARKSAREAKRSADAAERSAAAEEQAAEAAHAALAIEHERAQVERRARDAEMAPAFNFVTGGTGIAEFWPWQDERSLLATLRNVGRSAGTLESAELRHPGGRTAGEIVEADAGIDGTVLIGFNGCGELVRQAAEPLVLTVVYGAIDSPYRAMAQIVLRRAGSDHTGQPSWRSDEPHVDPLDPGEAS